MKPITQTIFGEGKGNCFAACVASVLEAPLEDVPNFCADHAPDEWWGEFTRWLDRFGMTALRFPYDGDEQVWADAMVELLPDTFVLAGGPTPRGPHCVIYCNGHMVHDPHPSRSGLQRITAYEVFVSRDPAVPLWRPQKMRDLVRQNILLALEATDGKVRAAAKLLGIGRATLYRRLEEYKRQSEAPGV